MTYTALSLVQEFTDKLGLPRPNALISATDKSVRQYKALLAQTVRDLSEYKWPEQTIRKAFTTIAGVDQGKLVTLFGEEYAGIVKDTMWNNTRHMRIFGPITNTTFNALQTLPNAGPEFLMYISREHLFLTPEAVAGEEITASIISKFNIVHGATYQELITDDGDKLLFPDNVVSRYFEAIWRKQKGESGWTDDWNDAMGLIAKNIVKDGGGKTLSMNSNPNLGPRPGIIIPPGNWNV